MSLIVPRGTQIVLINNTKILDENRFYQKGTVGKIVTQPGDAFHAYKVGFPDGGVAMVNRKDFSIHKQFKNEQIGLGSGMDDLELNDFVIYRCIVGSRAFGLDDENSDTDYRGIFLPPSDLHWSLYGVPEQIENKENEECYWELQKFLTLALKANPNILECLYTPLIEYQNEIAEELLSIKNIFLSQLVYQTYNGYVMSQFKKLEQDLRNRGEIKNKHAMHLIRLLLQGIHILLTGELETDVSVNKTKLLAIKFGEMDWREVDEWRLALHREFEDAFNGTKLPERPDFQAANQFLIRARKSMVK